MKQLFIFLFILIFISNINAQTNTNRATVKFGPEYVMNNQKYQLKKIISAQSQQYLLIGNELVNFSFYGRVLLANAGSDLRIRNLIPLTFQGADDIEELIFLDMYEIKDNIYVFGIINDKKSQIRSLYMLTLDNEELVASKPRKLGAFNYNFNYNYTNSFNVTKFQVSVSQDSSKILIFYPAPYKAGMPQKFGAMVFDANMNRIWANEFELPYTDENFVIDKFFVTNNGQIVLNCAKYEGKNSTLGRLKEKNYSFLLLITDEKGQNVKEVNIDVKDKYISQMIAGSLPNNDIVCGGLTFSKKESSKASGYFYAVIDHINYEIKRMNTSNFSPEFIAEGLGKYESQDILNKSANGEEVALNNCKFKDIVVNNDGSVILFIEQINEDNDIDMIYSYDDIVIMKFNPDGEKKFIVKIPKRQHINGADKSLISYIYTIKNDNIYIIYNDNIKNYESPQPLLPKEFNNLPAMARNNWGLALCTIDTNGNISRELLFSNKEQNGFFALPVNSKIKHNKDIALLLAKTPSLAAPSFKLANIKIQ